MSDASHSRTSSQTTAASSVTNTSSAPMLEHVLSCPNSYEIPLRTMYTLNCAPRAQPLPSHRQRAGAPSSAPLSPTASQFPRQDAASPTNDFQSAIASQLAQLPSHPSSLPPSFVTNFVRRVFNPEIMKVDFPQALTALDYLKDLETRRRREVAAALQRLGVESGTLSSEVDGTLRKCTGIASWVHEAEEKEKTIDALYTQLYIGLRRWTLINELSLTPFNRHNCLAMLNTLYPPVISSQPTTKLSPTILSSQREGFFRYVQGVEKRGPKILENLMQQGKSEGDMNGWTVVAQTLDAYLCLANSVITECAAITDANDLTSTEEASKRKGRKVDSGVSFNSDKRPSTAGSSGSGNSEWSNNKPLPPPPARTTVPSTKSSGSFMQKLRKMRVSARPEVEEIVRRPEPDDKENWMEETSTFKQRGLRKMRSLGALSERNLSVTSLLRSRNVSPAPAFDALEMNRRRLEYVGNSNKSKHRHVE
ncbi:hypothetical protein W97_07400 [Coniosporium apollinis CBS 100218]|uniref:Uncharacterized protein n=1 Tax=Coniosporium apollinis (strain CBS 100218) TaxID=1168221 RepID=R7Z1D5_CONA1|nr:uncharacterized protein W97_07400 [Coniosporium apollinis CBS 100218]EON67903.1 hypothetical protein W97_07400 [Coniosporium apollinis CBS 100218]